MSPSVYTPPILADREVPACVGEDPELWFAGERQPVQQAEALALCAVCPQKAKAVCLQRALRDGEDFGIFGGLFPAERSVLALAVA